MREKITALPYLSSDYPGESLLFNEPSHQAVSEEEIFSRIMLLLLPRVGNYTANQWVVRHGSARTVVDMITQGIIHLSSWNSTNIQQLLRDGNMKARAILRWCAENQIQLIPSDSALFPKSLAKMPSYPLILFAKGNLNLLKDQQPYLSIFGKRFHTAFGARAIHSIVEYISHYEMGVVTNIGTQSGHQAAYSAIRAGRPPIIISPMAFDQMFKSNHRKVMQYVLDHRGLILTDQIPGDSQRSFYQILSQVRVQIATGSAVMLTESDPGCGTSFAVLLGRQLELPIFATSPTKQWATQNPELIKLLRDDKSIIPIACREDAWKITDYFRLQGKTSRPLTLAKGDLPEDFIRSVVAWN